MDAGIHQVEPVSMKVQFNRMQDLSPPLSHLNSIVQEEGAVASE